jgi:hypothetical protein
VHWDIGVRLLMLSDVVCVPGGLCQSIYCSDRYGAGRGESLGCVPYDVEGLCDVESRQRGC